MKEKNKTMPIWARSAINVLLGAFIGVGAILPGLSGGVMCVLFGIYAPLMETLAHPISGLKKYWKMLLPVIIGVAVGFVAFASLLDTLIGMNKPLMYCIFIGLIIGTLPSLWKEAGTEKRKASSYITLVASFVFMLILFSAFGAGADDATDMAKFLGQYVSAGNLNVNPNFFWFIVAGAICGISIIVPGMSFSSPLMCLGLFDGPNGLTENLDRLMKLDMKVLLTFLLPFGIGGLATVLLLSKPVNFVFKKFSSIAYHFVLGAVLASLVLLIPLNYQDTSIWVCAIGLIGGGAAGYALDILQSKVKVE